MRVVDLFSGCGGLSLGFQDAGLPVTAAYDYWEAAVKTYESNFSHPAFYFDLSQTAAACDHIAQWNPDMIVGGPPCQDFSHAGKRTEGKQANLTLSFAKIVCKLRPEMFVMENVQRTKNSRNFGSARRLFKKAGYGLTEVVLDASFCGAPQKRKRFFCIGSLNAEDDFLTPLIEGNLADKPMTPREYLGDELGVRNYYRHPRNYNRRAVFSIDEPAPTVRGVNRPVPKGYPGHPGDTAKLTRSLRPLTTLERARLQTFPKNFKWTGPKTELEQMIGNAVPVKLAEFVATMVLAYQRQPGKRLEADVCV